MNRSSVRFRQAAQPEAPGQRPRTSPGAAAFAWRSVGRRGEPTVPGRRTRTSGVPLASRAATTSPASQPGARPCEGGRMAAVSWPLSARSHEVNELEFHISPAWSSSRPQVEAGNAPTRSSTRWAMSRSELRRSGLPTASAMSGMSSSLPAVHLVPEQARSTQPGRTDGSFAHDTAVERLRAPDGRHLDDEPCAVEAHLQRGVIEVERLAMLVTGRDRLEGEPAPAHEPGGVAGPQRQPVQVDARGGTAIRG